MLRFVTDHLGRVVDICLACERRVEYVRSLEAMLGIVRVAPAIEERRPRFANDSRMRILAFISGEGGLVTIARLVASLKLPRGRIDEGCKMLVRAGLLRRVRRGCYLRTARAVPPTSLTYPSRTRSA